MSDDNVIKFRKPQKLQNAQNTKAPQKSKRPVRLPPWVILILAALVMGAVTYALDQQKPAANAPSGVS